MAASLSKYSVFMLYESKPENESALQESLAKTLVQFYPLAGRYINDDHMVDCNDDGAMFVEAEAIDVELLDLVERNDVEQLVPPDSDEDSLLTVQATYFSCGGMALAVSVSHRVFDASSLGTFVAAWSSAANTKGMIPSFAPSFDFPSFFPYKDQALGIFHNSILTAQGDIKFLIKRLCFDVGALTILKSRIRRNNGRSVSGVGAVCALIAKALIRLECRRGGGRGRSSVVVQAVNLRERTIPPHPKHSCGNFVTNALTRRVDASEANEIGLDELADLMGDSVRQSITAFYGPFSPDILINSFVNLFTEISDHQTTNAICFSDWSKFGFYEADFGWGKPVGTSISLQMLSFHNVTILMTSKGGDGIEAWVHLKEDDVSYFEEDEEIKLFTT